MHKVGEIVLYGTDGVCKISAIEEKKFGKETSRYYVLTSVYRNTSVIYVPVGNDKLESKMRTVMSRKEIEDMIDYMPNADNIWIENEAVRKVRYKEIIIGGDRYELVRMIKTLHAHRVKQEKCGKKMHISDEKFLKDGEKILYDEIAHVLKLAHEEVIPYISEKLKV